MSEDQPDVRPEDALQVAQRALAKANEMERTVEDHEERIAQLEAAIPDRSDYETLDTQTKVGIVREHLVKRAQEQSGRAAIDYQGVMWEAFDGEPSADHCYTLMERAASAEGFDVRDPKKGNKQLTVNLDATKATLGFSRANKESAAGDR